MSLSLRPATLVERENLQTIALLALAVLLGAFLRLGPVLSADFALNDGGLFYTLVQDIRAAGYSLPLYGSYNGISIPFAYPPLALYLAALLADLTGVPLVELLRFFPAAVSILAIPAFYLLGRVLLQSRTQALLALFAFALLPQGFTKYIMGGGLTRAPGTLFALLALQQADLLYRRRQLRFAWTAALFAGLAVLSHPEAAWLTCYSGALLFLFHGRHRRGLVGTLIVVAVVLLLTGPWWLTVILRHGPAPLLAAAETAREPWYSWFPRLAFYFTADLDYVVASLTTVGLVGLAFALARRHLLLPLWLVAIFILSPRASATFAAIPLALLVGIGLDQVILPGVRRLAQGGASTGAGGAAPAQGAPGRPARRRSAVLAGTLLVLFLVQVLLSAWLRLSFWSPIPVLPREDRDAFHWIAGNTAQDSRFVVIAADNPYWNPVEEWFPVLAGRASLTTVQGYEWLPGGQYARQLERCAGPFRCMAQEADCLEDWARGYGESFSHVYISPGRAGPAEGAGFCPVLADSLRASADYLPLYDRGGVMVFARLAAGGGP